LHVKVRALVLDHIAQRSVDIERHQATYRGVRWPSLGMRTHIDPLSTALITPELPSVWDASYFRVEDPGAEDGELVAAETRRR
ncbi:MAG TPA: hypothetical protein VKA47_02830, partial [Solirubrobacterales bacterium]|nr:hypothetical protein [Solirubrobacterales bacterium]